MAQQAVRAGDRAFFGGSTAMIQLLVNRNGGTKP
jgi:hypothetical protein